MSAQRSGASAQGKSRGTWPARTLLMLADVKEEGQTREIAPHITQATLAEIVGTTRPRVSHFMNKFRNAGYISYDSHLHVRVHGSLLSVVLRETS